MKRSTLVLHRYLSSSDFDIMQVARNLGWRTVQLDRANEHGWDALPTSDVLRYYGNTSHRSFSRRSLPIRFNEIDPSILSSIPWATHREITLMGLLDLRQPLLEPLFVKPVQGKWFKSKVYCEGEPVEASPVQMSTDDLRDRLIYTCAPVRFGEEVRCWCLDGEVLTSRLRRLGEKKGERAPVADLVREVYERCPTLPRAVVMDVSLLPDNQTWAIVEFNRPWAASLSGCDPEKCFQCLVASQQDLVPA